MSGSGTGIVTPYTTHRAIDLDGAADNYTSGDPTGLADGQLLIISTWFRIDGGDGTLRYLFWNQGTRFQVSLTAANQIDVQGRVAGGGTIFQQTTTPTYLAGSGWHQLLSACDLSVPTSWIYVDGAVPALGTNTALNAGNIDFTRGSWGYGATFAGGNRWNGGISEMYLTNEFIADTQANRELWRHPNGQPPSISADGSGPTATQPILYLVEEGGVLVNRGSGGALVTVGAPALSADSPKDRWTASLRHRRRKRRRHAA